jgi:hypothetical protein
MVTKVSSRKVIQYVSRKFRFNNDGWVGNAFEWIGNGLSILNLIGGFEPAIVEKELSSYKVKLPTCASALLSVDYEGYHLPLDRPSKFTDGAPRTPHRSHRGYIVGDWLQCSAETGTITFHVLKPATDDLGYPMIPDSSFLLEALSWFILREWLSQGNVHPVFNWKDANINWETWWPRAQNDVDFPNLYNQEAFTNMWVSLIPQLDLYKNGNIVTEYADGYTPVTDEVNDFRGNTLV